MKEITATHAARRFSEMLDAVEHDGETFVIRRGAKVIATVAPAHRPTGKDLKDFLRTNPPDEEWFAEILATRRLLLTEDRT